MYHGKQNYAQPDLLSRAGAIAEIVTEAKAHADRKAFVCSDPDLDQVRCDRKGKSDCLTRKVLLMKLFHY